MKAVLNTTSSFRIDVNSGNQLTVSSINQDNTITAMKIPQVTQQTVKVNNFGGTLVPSAPITLKNQLGEITSIEDIADVAEIDVVDGATLVYNAATNLYEIKPLPISDLQVDIDGGTF
jgi:hypothetical protein